MKTKGLISVFLALILCVGCAQGTVLALAEDGSSTASTEVISVTDTTIETLPSTGEMIEEEMRKRDAVTANRSAIKSTSEVAVYKNGSIVYEGKFRDGWQKAIDLAPTTISNPKQDDFTLMNRYDDQKIASLDNIEFVLNKDINFEYKYSGPYDYGALYIKSKKLTIDLNGHLLRRTDFDSELWSGSVISAINYSVVTIMDSNPKSEHVGRIDDHVWKYDNKKGTVKLNGGIITGGQWRWNYGGGIFLDKGAQLTMTGGTIAGNRAVNGSGIYVGKKCTVDMTKGTSQICYNGCKGSNKDGGAIALNGSGVVVKGGYVHHNWSEDYGAGVYFMAEASKAKLTSMVIYANKAVEEGGGIYVEGYLSIDTLVNDCRIVGNYSGERGGGIYAYGKLSVYNSTIENNCSKEHGGGLCISNYFKGSKVAIGGVSIIRKNYKSSEKNMENATDNSNLYIQGNDTLVVHSALPGSEIWVRTGKSADSYHGVENRITAEQTNCPELYFFSDNTNYNVKYQNDPGKSSFRHLYLASGSRTRKPVETLDNYETVKQKDDYAVLKGANAGKKFPLYRGTFEYNLMSTSEFSSASPFYYTDGYFFEDPKEYNYHLATMSINMAVAAFGRSTKDVGSNNYANHFANVKQLMSDIGCKDEYFFANDDYQMKPQYYGNDGRLSTIGVAMSHKNVRFENVDYTIVPIAIRGGGYEIEWASNVTIGSSGEATGFSDAANQVFGHVQNYISKYGMEERLRQGYVKFWVVGYSRAGATANITSKMLVDRYASQGNTVFGYTFEAPMGGIKEAKIIADYTDNGEYKTIHNTVNENDFVTLVAPSEMGFIRYGVDKLVGSNFKGNDPVSYTTSSKYYKQRQKMIKQLAAINPYYNFDDGWQVADVNIILGNIPIIGTDIIDKGEQSWDDPNPECQNIYEFLRWFFKRVQADGLLLPTKNGKPDYSLSREYYSKKKFLANISGNNKTNVPYSSKDYNFGYSDMSVQEAVCGLMVLMQSMSSETMNELMNVVMSGADGMLSDLLSFDGGKIALAVGNLLLPQFWGLLPMSIINIFSDLLNLYDNLINDWDVHSDSKRADTINNLMHDLLDKRKGMTKTVWDVLKPAEAKIVAEGIPVVLYFALNYASHDYNDTSDDDGMWGVGTFINNMDSIVANHYQEVSVAWVRSYDSFYANDTQAYKIDKKSVTAPTASYDMKTKKLTMYAEEGSSVFYTTDEGKTWNLYTEALDYETKPEGIKMFSISRGVKSTVVGISSNNAVGAFIGNGGYWFIIIGVLVIAGAVVAAVIIVKKKKNM